MAKKTVGRVLIAFGVPAAGAALALTVLTVAHPDTVNGTPTAASSHASTPTAHLADSTWTYLGNFSSYDACYGENGETNETLLIEQNEQPDALFVCASDPSAPQTYDLYMTTNP